MTAAKRKARAAQQKRATAAAKRAGAPKKKAAPKKQAAPKKKATPTKAEMAKELAKLKRALAARKKKKPAAKKTPLEAARAKLRAAQKKREKHVEAAIRALAPATAPVHIAKTAMQAVDNAKRKAAAEARMRQQVAASTGFRSKFFSGKEVAKREAAKREEEESKGLGIADLLNYDSSEDESYGSALTERDQERQLKRQGAQYLSWSDKTAKGKPCTGPIGRYNGKKWCPTGDGGKYNTLSGWDYVDPDDVDPDL